MRVKAPKIGGCREEVSSVSPEQLTSHCSGADGGRHSFHCCWCSREVSECPPERAAVQFLVDFSSCETVDLDGHQLFRNEVTA